MTLTTEVSSALVDVATEFKRIRTLISGSGTGDVSGLNTDAANLVAAVNEVLAELQALLPANAAGWLHDDGTGTLVWSTPTAAQVGADPTGTAAALIDDASAALDHVWSASKSKAYADALIAANDAMVYKGTIDASTNPNYPAASRGDFYKISAAGKIGGGAGINVEVGDSLICGTDGTAADNQAAVGANWTILQTNVDGAVTGPAASTAGDFATFNGAGGKTIQDSGISLDTDNTMAANSDTRLPSQKAVKGYAYSKTEIGDITVDLAAVFTAALT